jgi:hypothetical protein
MFRLNIFLEYGLNIKYSAHTLVAQVTSFHRSSPTEVSETAIQPGDQPARQSALFGAWFSACFGVWLGALLGGFLAGLHVSPGP